MRVSVLIPVYNAALYIEQAVQSALIQVETAEVILADDGSTDDSLSICQHLATADKRVRVIQHPDKANHGEAATRNLLLEHADHEFISFLDADDFYVPDRFTVAAKRIQDDDTIDGVYETVIDFFENQVAQARYAKMYPEKKSLLTGVHHPLQGVDLLETIITRHNGVFLLPSVVIRRAAFERIGEFPPLAVSPDIPILVKMAALCNLVPGDIANPRIQRRIHDHNLYGANPRLPIEMYAIWKQVWMHVYEWGKTNLEPRYQQLVARQLIYNTSKLRRKYIPAFVSRELALLRLAIESPDLLRYQYYWYRLVANVFSGNAPH